MTFRQKYFSIIAVLILYLALINSSCSEDNPVVPPPPVQKQFVKLSTLTVTSTEAFIGVSANDTLLPLNITLDRDDSPVFSFNLTNNDTTIIDTNLSPGGSYNYNAAAVINGEGWTGDKLQVQTLPTTSHNFTWQTFTFGEPSAGSSVLNDVAIIDEDNIWAVGEIYMNDSLGQPDPLPYNAVHWDGNNWELKRIQTYFRGNLITVPLEGIFTFTSTDIWMVGSLPIHGDGTNWTMYDLRTTVDPNLSLSKAWGKSSNDIYFVGRAGSIAHYQNGSWSKIESETSADIKDIWGFTDPETHLSKILSVAFTPGETRILTLNSKNASDTLNWPINMGLGSIWFDKFKLFVSGSGVWGNKNNTWQKMSGVPNYFLNTIRGEQVNNIYAVGWTVRMVHYNGVEWSDIVSIPVEFGLESVDAKGNKVISVGFASSGGVVGKAVILMGTQN